MTVRRAPLSAFKLAPRPAGSLTAVPATATASPAGLLRTRRHSPGGCHGVARRGISAVFVVAALAEFCAASAPSGAEGELADLLGRRWRGRCREMQRDAVGNVVARLGGAGPRLLLQAHMDQVGYVVRYVTEDGFLLLDGAQGDRRSGPERRHGIGHPVRVLARDGTWIDGVLGAASGHVLSAEQRDEHRIGYDDFWVEVGLPSRQAVLDTGVHVGASVVFGGALQEIGELLVAPSMDDRVALALMDALLATVNERDLSADVWLAATVQEENGLHGSRALAHAERFDAVVALEIGLVGDVPGVQARDFTGALGKGPIAVHRDTGIAYDRILTQHLLELARTAGLSVQDGVFAGYRSDGLTFAEAGSPTALLAVPTRYTHTPFETVHPADLEATVELLHGLVTSTLPPRA